jgi:hypothetical protein
LESTEDKRPRTSEEDIQKKKKKRNESCTKKVREEKKRETETNLGENIWIKVRENTQDKTRPKSS